MDDDLTFQASVGGGRDDGSTVGQASVAAVPEWASDTVWDKNDVGSGISTPGDAAPEPELNEDAESTHPTEGPFDNVVHQPTGNSVVGVPVDAERNEGDVRDFNQHTGSIEERAAEQASNNAIAASDDGITKPDEVG